MIPSPGIFQASESNASSFFKRALPVPFMTLVDGPPDVNLLKQWTRIPSWGRHLSDCISSREHKVMPLQETRILYPQLKTVSNILHGEERKNSSQTKASSSAMPRTFCALKPQCTKILDTIVKCFTFSHLCQIVWHKGGIEELNHRMSNWLSASKLQNIQSHIFLWFRVWWIFWAALFHFRFQQSLEDIIAQMACWLFGINPYVFIFLVITISYSLILLCSYQHTLSSWTMWEQSMTNTSLLSREEKSILVC